MPDEPSTFVTWGASVQGEYVVRPPSSPSRRSSARGRLVVAAVVVAAAIAAVLLITRTGSGSGSGLSTLAGGSFTTPYPTAFLLSITHPVAGVTNYQLTSPRTAGVPLAIQGPPPAGVIEITVSEGPVALVATEGGDPGAATQSPLQLLSHSVGLPSGAQSLVNSVSPHSISLDGVPAAAVSYTYSDDGVADVQSDVVARNGQTVEGIELDTEPSLAADGTTALNTLLAHWHWSQS